MMLDVLGFSTDKVVLERYEHRLEFHFGSNPQLIVSRFKRVDGWRQTNWHLIDNYWYPERGCKRGMSDPWPIETTPETMAEAMKEALADHKIWFETGDGPDVLERRCPACKTLLSS